MALSDSEKGKMAEMLVAVAAVVQSDGLLRISLPLVDDDGVDLHATHKITRKTLLLQIKSAFTLNGRGEFRADVRKETLGFDQNKLLVFVFFDTSNARLSNTLWVVPVPDFRQKLRRQKESRTKFCFASKFTAPRDMWKPYRIPLNNLGSKLVSYLTD
jgi:hypothetical protein